MRYYNKKEFGVGNYKKETSKKEKKILMNHQDQEVITYLFLSHVLTQGVCSYNMLN